MGKARVKSNSKSNSDISPLLSTVSTEIDRTLAICAIEKQKGGKEPNAKELAALRRIEKAREEAQRWAFYHTIPQKHWREMGGGWQTKMLQEQADRYGIPFSGPIIDLPAVVLALRKFLATNAHRLAAETDDMMVSANGKETAAMRRYREAKANMIELDLAERQGQLVPLDQMHARLTRICSGLRRAGEVLQRRFGTEAWDILNDALDEAEREFFGDVAGTED